ncbi:MAG: DNA primase [Caldilineaceae bacterium]|nr:DNA primase [Caldilineaceae bacterium]
MDELEQIRDRIDLVEFIGRYVTLSRAGSTYKACCPFHQEKTPSFVVSPERGTWHCFGACGEGGDLFKFLMKIEGLEFFDALKKLAAEVGVELARKRQAPDPLDPVREIMGRVAAFYATALYESADGQIARDYLRERGVAPEMVDAFQLGYSDRSWDSLVSFLQSQGISESHVLQTGLLYHDERQGAYRDRYRGRLMFPIRDARGRVVGFGARELGSESRGAKYINSPTTPLFNKSQVLYGIEHAAGPIRKLGEAVLVEGYLDVVTAHQFGFANTVACLGTAVTPGQLGLLRRYTSQVVFALDADAAGQQATLRGLEKARATLRTSNRDDRHAGRNRPEMALRIAAMPEGRDPDELIRADVEGWKKVTDGALTLVNFYANHAERAFDLEVPEQKQKAVELLVEVLAEVHQEVARDEYVKQMEIRFATAPGLLQRMVANRMRLPEPDPVEVDTEVAWEEPSRRPAVQLQEPGSHRNELERKVLLVLLRDPHRLHRQINSLLTGFESDLPVLTAGDFIDNQARTLYGLLLSVDPDDEWDVDEFMSGLDEAEAAYLRRVLAEQDGVLSGPAMEGNTNREACSEAVGLLLRMRELELHRRLKTIDMVQDGVAYRTGMAHLRRIQNLRHEYNPLQPVRAAALAN